LEGAVREGSEHVNQHLWNMEDAILELEAAADWLDSLSIAASHVKIQPRELALIAGRLRDRQLDLLGLWDRAIEWDKEGDKAPGMPVCVMAANRAREAQP
jgi:hypothetical protein